MPKRPPIVPTRLVLMGTGPFAVPSFDALAHDGHEIVCVITRPEKAARPRQPPPPSPVRQWAMQRGLPIEAPESINDPDAIEMLRALQPELLVVCDYGQILSPACLAAAPLGGINLHGSLLPAYRGAAPVQWAVLKGEEETGVSVIHITPQLDAGPVLALARTRIGATENAGELEERLAAMGVDEVRDALSVVLSWDGQSPLGQPQDSSKASKAPRLQKQDGRVDWQRPAVELDWHVRGMAPWPGAFTELGDEGKQPRRITIRQATPLPDHPLPRSARPGQVLQSEPELLVATGRGALRIDRLQAAGKKEMPSADYLRGNPIPVGAVLS